MRSMMPFPLARDERGTSVIELAIIAPLLSLLTMGIVDLSTGFARRLELTEAVDSTMTQVSSGDFKLKTKTDGSFDFSEFRATAAAAAKVDVSAVTAEAWLECDGVPQASFEGSCGAGGRRVKPGCEPEIPSPPAEAKCFPVEARYLRVRINSSFRPMFASVVAPRADGTYPLVAEAAVRIR
jgi:hypothetical protein